MEILVKQISKTIDEKRKVFFLDKKGNEFQVDWALPRFELVGVQLKKESQFNNKNYSFKGKCKLLAVGEGNEYEERHIFLNRQTKHRYYLTSKDFKANFEPKTIEEE